MNKAELIANVAATAGLTKKDAEKAINAFIESVEGVLLKYVRLLREQAEIPLQVRKSKSLLARSLLSKLVRA